MKHTETKTATKKRIGWAPMWLLAFLFALPSCFEISCIKLTGCELLADDEVTEDDMKNGNTSGDFDFSAIDRPSETASQLIRDFVLD